MAKIGRPVNSPFFNIENGGASRAWYYNTNGQDFWHGHGTLSIPPFLSKDLKNWLPSCPGDEAKTLWALIQDLWGCQTTSVHHSYANTSPAIADLKFGKESDQDTGNIKVEMANGQRLSSAEEESNATAEATDLPSARQFLLKVPFGLYILLVQWKVTIVT